MDEEIEGDAQTTYPTEETFSFFDVLDGKAYPKDTITVYLDDAAAYDLRKLNKALREAIDSGDATDEDVARFNAEAQSLKARIEASAYTFHLTAVSSELMQDALDAADKKFEAEKVSRKRADGSLIRELPQNKQVAYAKYVSAVTLSLHTEKIVDAAGRTLVAPSPDEAFAFLGKAPDASVASITRAISALRVSALDFEAGLDEGFFPKP